MLFFIMSKGIDVFYMGSDKIVPFAFGGLEKSVNLRRVIIKGGNDCESIFRQN